MTFFRSVLALAVLVGVALGAPPAAAHEGKGVLTVEEATVSPSGVRYVVRLIWENDGDAAIDSTITATPIDPAGSPQTPVALTPIDADGRYGASVELPSPGDWTVRFTAVTPTATIERVETVAQPETTTTTSAPSTTTTDAASTATSTTVAGDDQGDGDDDGSAAPVLVIGAIVLAAAVGGFVFMRRRRGNP